MSTTIRTLSGTRYPVSAIKVADTGRVVMVARQASGKARYLTRPEVGSARWYAALEHIIRKRR